MTDIDFIVGPADPHSPEVGELLRLLSAELASRYDHTDDGSGNFRPEDAVGPGRGFLVGRLRGELVACGAFRPLEGAVCEIKRMFVRPEMRGRGYAGLLLRKLERLALAEGYAFVRLETGVRQPEAIRLYERSGYRRVENFGIYVGDDQSVCFEKQLG